MLKVERIRDVHKLVNDHITIACECGALWAQTVDQREPFFLRSWDMSAVTQLNKCYSCNGPLFTDEQHKQLKDDVHFVLYGDMWSFEEVVDILEGRQY